MKSSSSIEAMKEKQLRAAAEKLVRVLLPEKDEIADEVAEAIRQRGYKTDFSEGTHEQRTEWYVLDTMAALRALDKSDTEDALSEAVFSHSLFEPLPESESVLSPAIALGFNLEAMRMLSERIAAHYPEGPDRKRALRAIVAMFDAPIGSCIHRIRERVEQHGRDIIAGKPAALPVFSEKPPETPQSDSGIGQFSEREREVFGLVALGMENACIAEELYLSESTVKSHVRSMLVKTGLKNRTQLALLGVTSGAVDDKTVRDALSRTREQV